mmetsp:Transcript_5612/g.14294  ORF Transcript_5612/g.14294 Transcript_5612/m.14294 type:complete len:232 (-) Transcript_5612:12-707(-)|eukprot:jgi/Tetstr1/464983/TSEL_009714.t1
MESNKGMMSQYLSDSIVAADRSVAAVLSYERAPSRAQSTAEKAGSAARSQRTAGASVSGASPRQRAPRSNASGAPGRSEDAMWKGPTSEAGSGYSYPETAVTSRIAESISETELNFFMSKIATLEEEMQRERQRGEKLAEELNRLEVQSQTGSAASSAPSASKSAARKAASNAATAGLTSNATKQKAAAKHIVNTRPSAGNRPSASAGWGYATLAQTGQASLRPVRPKPSR